jgi:type II secretory pathway pseudopilin PulG
MNKSQKGESVLEIILAIAVFAILMPTILYVVGSTVDRQSSRNMYFESIVLMENIQDSVRQQKSENWNNFAQDATFFVDHSGPTISFSEVQEIATPLPGGGLVAHVISSPAYRDNFGNIVENGGAQDPATRKIVISVDWYGAVKTTEASTYITRTDRVYSIALDTYESLAQGATQDGVGVSVSETSTTEARLMFDANPPGPLLGALNRWSFDGDNFLQSAEIDLAEGGTDNLFFEGSPTFVESRFGKGLQTGEDGVRLYASSSARLNISSPTSFAFWMMSQDKSTTQTILDKKTDDLGYLVSMKQDGRIDLSVGDGSTSVSASTLVDVADGKWHMIAFVHDNNSIHKYIDGVRENPSIISQTPLLSTDDIIAVGNDNETATSPFLGLIDDLAIYAHALSDEDIRDLFYATYKSKSVDMGAQFFAHGISANIERMVDGLDLRLQVATHLKSSGVCQQASEYSGPDGTTGSYFVISHIGSEWVFLPFPTEYDTGSPNLNPAECVNFKVYATLSNDVGVPAEEAFNISNIKIIYSP